MESVKIAVDMREPEEMVSLSLLTGLGVSVEVKFFALRISDSRHHMTHRVRGTDRATMRYLKQ